VYRGRDAARFAVIGLAYFLAHELGFLFPDSQRVLAAAWPAGGVGLAALLLSERRHWRTIVAVLFVSGAASDLLAGRPFVASACYMTANVIESWASAWLVTRWCGAHVRFSRVKEILALIAAAVFVNAATAAMGAATAAITSALPFSNFWFTWWVADGLGILLVTPLIVTWSDLPTLLRNPRWSRVLETCLLLAVLILVSRFSMDPATVPGRLAPRPYMAMGILAWAGLRLGRRSVSLALILLAAIAVTSKVVTEGALFWPGATPADRLLAVQIYLGFLAGTGFLLTAAYEESKAAELRLRFLGDNLPSGAVYQLVMERDGSRFFQYMSAGIEEMTGVPAEEVLRDPGVLYDMILEEDRGGLAAAEKTALHDLAVFRSTVRMRRTDGQIRWMQLSSSPRRGENGRMIWDGIHIDVTERKEAEEKLHAAHAELTAIHVHAPVSLLVVDEEFKVRNLSDFPADENGAAGPLTDQRPGDVLHCLNALLPEHGCRTGRSCGECTVRNTLLDTLRNGTKHDNVEAWLPVDVEGRSEMRCMLLFTGPLRLRNSRRALVCVLDITDRKRAELDLRNSEARFRTLTQDAPIAISMSRAGLVVYANPSYVRMFGYAGSEELEGRPTLGLFAPQSREEVETRGQRRAKGLPVPGEFEAVGTRRDGSEFPMLLAVIEMRFEEGPALVAFITDLTAPKNAAVERAHLEQQLQQAQKMESIGRLAGGVAHDFNNLLTVINGFSSLLMQKLDGEPKLWSYAEQVRKAAERGARLTRQLLAFSRQEVIKPIPSNLNWTLAEAEPMLRRLLGERVSIAMHLDPELSHALVDPAQVDQVILNLAANAKDAMPDGGILEITTRNVEIAGTRWVQVTVADNGVGMDEATRGKIFEPFFTTKGVGQGTGLGLATVYGVMQQNSGWIEVHSAPGEGTSFELFFPPIDAQLVPVETENHVEQTEEGGQTLLLVEDEDPVREFLKTALEDLGYNVLQAPGSLEALALAERYTGPIHLLITDVVMPGLNGRELADRLRILSPKTKAIFMSGYLSDVIARSGVLDREVAFIQKPVSLETLESRIRQVLQANFNAE
jgi:PAS domain S-box-containing protein